MDNRYNARYRNMDGRGAPGRMYPENPAGPSGMRDDYRGNWYAGQQPMTGRNPMENTRENMRRNAGNPYMDMRRGPQSMQMQPGMGMQPGPGPGQNIRQGMPQRGGMRQQQGPRRPQEPMGQIYGTQPPGGQMGQQYMRRPMPGGMGPQGGQPMGPQGGQPMQMRRNFMNPMGGMPTDDMR